MAKTWWRNEIKFWLKFAIDNLYWMDGDPKCSEDDWDCMAEQGWAIKQGLSDNPSREGKG
jgi:hypothetical protein